MRSHFEKTIIFLLMVFIFHPGRAQFPQWNRLVLFAGNAYDNVSAVHTDINSNYYIAGQIQDVYGPGSTDFTGGCQALNPLRADDVDGFVFRYDSSYTSTLKFAVPGRIYSLATDSKGNIIVAGISEYNYSFDGGLTVIPGSGTGDGYVAKYSPNGTILWYRIVKSGDVDAVTSVDTDKDDNILVAGFSNGQESFIFDRTVNSSVGHFINFVILCNSDGNVEWINITHNDIRIQKAIFDKNRDVVFTGFRLTDSAIAIKAAAGKMNGSNGAIGWTKLWGEKGNTYIQKGEAIAIAANGDYVFGGEYSGAAVFDQMQLTAKGYIDIFLAKTDTAGNIQWLQNAGSNDFDKIYDIQISNNQIYFCGGFSNYFSIGNQVLHAVDYTDVFVAAADMTGKINWALTGGSSSTGHKGDFFYHEFAAQMVIDKKGRIQVGGTTIGSGAFGNLQYSASEKANQNGFWATITDIAGSSKISYPCSAENTLGKIELFPNPFNDHIAVRFANLAASTVTQWSLYDVVGRLYRKSAFTGPLLEINQLQVLAPGLYIIRIDGAARASVRIIKSR